MSNIYVESGKRIFYLDELRAIAILCVILCHTSNLYLPHVYYNLKVAIPSFLNIIGLVGVPLFFMLSGALLLNRDYNLVDFFKRRFSRILYPAIFWIILTSILVYPFFGVNEVIKIIFAQHRYTWFVWTMIGIYLIIPVINSFIKEFKFNGIKYFLLIWFVTVILETFNLYPPLENLELSYFYGYVGYLVLGYYLVNKEFKLSNFSLIILGLILAITFTFANMYINYNNIHIYTSYLSIFVALAATGIVLLFRGLSDYFENKNSNFHKKVKNGFAGKLIFLLSSCSYGMYFANSLILKFVNQLNITSLKLLPVIYILVVILSLVLVYLLSKISILKRFSGAS